MKRVVLGIVETPLQADGAVRRLGQVGISPRDVSILYPDRHGDHDFGFEAHSKTPEGALIGIGFGAILGSTVALTLALVGVVVNLAPIVAALAGAAVGALFLGLAGAALGATVPEIEAKYYEGKSMIGTILVAVHTRTTRDQKLARAVLTSVIASDITATTEAVVPSARA